MYKSNYNKASLDNPYAGNVSADYVSADGERNNIFKFIMLRDIVKGGLTIFGRGELVNGKFLDNGKVAVKIKPRYRNIIGKDFIAMVINKDLMYARTSSFDDGTDENDTDMLMGNMLDYEVKSNATSLLSVAEPLPTITPITPTVTTAITPVRDAVAAPITTTSTTAPTTVSLSPTPRTEVVAPISTVSELPPRSLTEATPTLSVAPTTTISALPPRSLTVASEIPVAPKTFTPIVTPTTTPAPTTIITPVVPMSDVILPYPMMVSPNPSVLPSSGSGMMSGGGGGSMSGGGGGGSAEKSAEQSAEGGETAAVASATPVVAVVEKKIFGMKPMYAYSIGGLALLAAGIYAYKKYYK
jgi:hypothetical protein